MKKCSIIPFRGGGFKWRIKMTGIIKEGKNQDPPKIPRICFQRSPSPAPTKFLETKSHPHAFFKSDGTTRPAYTLGTTPIFRLFLITLNQRTPKKPLPNFLNQTNFGKKWKPQNIVGSSSLLQLWTTISGQLRISSH